MKTIHFSYLGNPEPGASYPRRICGDLYLPEEDVPVRAVVQFVHGMDEHIGRYREFAEFLTANGIVLCGEDHRGHGRSTERDAHGRLIFGSFAKNGDGWQIILGDLFRLRDILKRKFADVPYFLMGHSMGSFLVRSMLLSAHVLYDGVLADGIILSGTAYYDLMTLQAERAVIRAYGRKHGREEPFDMAMGLLRLLYNSRIPKEEYRTPFDWISSDPETLENHAADPYCGHIPTVGLFDDMIGGLMAVCGGTKLYGHCFHVPVLLIAGRDDPVGNYGAGVTKTAAMLRRSGSSVRVKLYEKARHEVLLEQCRDTVMTDILTWMEAHIAVDAENEAMFFSEK